MGDAQLRAALVHRTAGRMEIAPRPPRLATAPTASASSAEAVNPLDQSVVARHNDKPIGQVMQEVEIDGVVSSRR